MSAVTFRKLGECISWTRTVVSRARADHGELIGLNTVGIEYGVSVSVKLA